MKCKNCGKEIGNDSNYCEFCGSSQFVDLGLPSGTLWKKENEIGYYNYDTAVQKFGNKLPTKEMWKELKNSCGWTWMGSGYMVVGRNGKSLFLPAMGGKGSNGPINGININGRYWSNQRTWIKCLNDAHGLWFCSDSIDIGSYHRSCELSVRLVKD